MKLHPDRRGQKHPAIVYGPNISLKPCPVCGWYLYPWEDFNTVDGQMAHAKHELSDGPIPWNVSSQYCSKEKP